MNDKISIYIHIPFCRKKCSYCDFYSITKLSQKEIFLKYIEKEILNFSFKNRFTSSAIKKYKILSLYFGGGTPSLLTIKEIQRIFISLNKRFRFIDKPEITIEVNPDDCTENYIKGLSYFFNRISIGIESFDKKILKKIGRSGKYTSLKYAIKNIKKYFHNFSIDLISGISGRKIIQDINMALSFEPTHISIYYLTLYEETELYKQKLKKEFLEMSEEKGAKEYKDIQLFLSNHGFEQYEVSNFSKKGMQSQHNMNYWNFNNYIGFGPSASGFFFDSKSIIGYRYTNHASITSYFKNKSFFSQENINGKNLINEYILCRMRTIDGLDNNELLKIFNIDIFKSKKKEISLLLENKLIEVINKENKQIIKTTEHGFILLNSILELLFF